MAGLSKFNDLTRGAILGSIRTGVGRGEGGWGDAGA